MSSKATLIYLEDHIVLTKKEYKDWHEIQDEYYENFKASLSPMTCEDIISLFQKDYKGEEWPFSKSRLIRFYQGEEKVISSNQV